MTEQLQAALDALNACPDAGSVAALLWRHGIKGIPATCSMCPVAEYFRKFGGVADVVVASELAQLDQHKIRMTAATTDFIREFDRGFGKFSGLVVD